MSKAKRLTTPYADLLPPHVRNKTELQAHYREQVLIHGTTVQNGNFVAGSDLVRQARFEGLEVEAKLRDYVETLELG